MKNIKLRLRTFARKLNLKNEYVLPGVIAVLLTAVVFTDSIYFENNLLKLMWLLIIFLIGGFVLSIMAAAGFSVIKSLFRIGAGLSLLIFLAQSYCAVPHVVHGNNALMGLLGVGFMYMVFDFSRSLYEVWSFYFKKLNDGKWSLGKVMVVLLFVVFAVYFVWAIYQVVSPIIFDLCVYKSS